MMLVVLAVLRSVIRSSVAFLIVSSELVVAVTVGVVGADDGTAIAGVVNGVSVSVGFIVGVTTVVYFSCLGWSRTAVRSCGGSLVSGASESFPPVRWNLFLLLCIWRSSALHRASWQSSSQTWLLFRMHSPFAHVRERTMLHV